MRPRLYDHVPYPWTFVQVVHKFWWFCLDTDIFISIRLLVAHEVRVQWVVSRIEPKILLMKFQCDWNTLVGSSGHLVQYKACWRMGYDTKSLALVELKWFSVKAQQGVIQRVKNIIHHENNELTRQPFFVSWFINQLHMYVYKLSLISGFHSQILRAVLIWPHEQSMVCLLELAKDLLFVVETLNFYWECPGTLHVLMIFFRLAFTSRKRTLLKLKCCEGILLKPVSRRVLLHLCTTCARPFINFSVTAAGDCIIATNRFRSSE